MAGVLLLGYALLLHLSWFWQGLPPVNAEPGLGNSLVVPWLLAHAHWQLPVILILLFLQGVLANNIVFTHRLAGSVNLFPGVFVVLLGSLLPAFLGYSGYLAANVFLLLGLRSLLLTFRVSSAADLIFNTGFWVGLAAFFVPTYLVFLLPISITLTILKSGKFRDQFMLLIGALLPLYLVGMGCYWYDQLPLYWEQQWVAGFALPQYIDWATLPLLSTGVMVAVTGVVLLSQNQYLNKTKMEVQTKISILYWLLLGALLGVLWAMPWGVYRWQAVVPVAGILLSFNFTRARPPVAEAWHLLLLLLLFFLHFSAIYQLFPV
jgi:hypothetical protein